MIKLKQIMPIENPSMYKIHVAKRSNDGYEPLDEYINGWDNWIGWNTYRGDGKPNRFTRKYVISFMHFYPQYGTFLFGGIFEILKTYSDRYEIRLCDMYKDFIGRLKVKNINTKRGSAFNFENHYETIEVVELLDKPYSSHVFPGYEWVNCPFSVMKNIIDKQTPDWKTALSKIKGAISFKSSLVIIAPVGLLGKDKKTALVLEVICACNSSFVSLKLFSALSGITTALPPHISMSGM